MYRVIGLCGAWFGVAVSVLVGWWWLAFLCILVGTILRGVVGLVAVALLLDSYYGTVATVPWFTIGALIGYWFFDGLADRTLAKDIETL